jgi:hypothetical protein
MKSHSTTYTYYWLDEVVKIIHSGCRTYFSIVDTVGNTQVFYDDDKQILYRAFRKVCPNAKITKE